MYVASYLELHTTLLGWMLYNVIFGILWETGLLMLPLLWMLVAQQREIPGRGEGRAATRSAVLHVKGTIDGDPSC